MLKRTRRTGIQATELGKQDADIEMLTTGSLMPKAHCSAAAVPSRVRLANVVQGEDGCVLDAMRCKLSGTRG